MFEITFAFLPRPKGRGFVQAKLEQLFELCSNIFHVKEGKRNGKSASIGIHPMPKSKGFLPIFHKN